MYLFSIFLTVVALFLVVATTCFIIPERLGTWQHRNQRETFIDAYFYRGTQRQSSENIYSEVDLRSRIFGTFFAKFLACLPLLGFSNI